MRFYVFRMKKKVWFSHPDGFEGLGMFCHVGEIYVFFFFFSLL